MSEATALLEYLGIVFVVVFALAAIYGACVCVKDYAEWRKRR